MGRCAGRVGDANGDGRLDFVVGARNENTATVYSPVCGAIASYGTGCPNASGLTPTLEVNGCATPGAAFQLGGTSGSFGTIPGLLVAGGSPSAAPLGGSCLLLVGAPHLIVPIVTTPFGIYGFQPKPPAWVGTGTVHMQAFFAAPGPPHGFAATAGVSITFE